MAVSSFCYQITISDSTDRIGKVMYYTPWDGTPVQVYLDDMGGILSSVGNGETTYYICSRVQPYFTEFGNQISPEFYGITISGGSSPCTSDADCLPNQGGGGGGQQSSYCYQIAINTSTTDINSVQFSYTSFGATSPSIVQARNWYQTSTSGSTRTLYLCTSTTPVIFINLDPIFDPQNYGINVTGGTSSCTTDSECWVQTPVNCTLSDWGYGETQNSFVVGAKSPCQLINGSYQKYQTRYVITPASNGGTCVGETIRYESCVPTNTGSTATLTTPTFSNVTASSVSVTTTISNNGGSDVTSVTFRIFKNGALINSSVLTDFRFGISVQFGSLLANSQYTVKAFATNSTGTSESPTGTFTTASASGISTPTISAITQSSAIVTSILTNSSGDVYSRYGVIYKVGGSDNLTVGSPGVVKVETGPYPGTDSPVTLTSPLNGLALGVQYYVKSYVLSGDGSTYFYSSAANFTTTGASQGENSAQIGITSVKFNDSAGSAESYRYITASSANPNRSYLSVIQPGGQDPNPGAYQLTTALQQVEPTSLVWSLYTKPSPSEPTWIPMGVATIAEPIAQIIPPGWTYYEYKPDLTTVTFRPGLGGYYMFKLSGRYLDGTSFNLSREVVIGYPSTSINIAYNELRQTVSSTIQLTSEPAGGEWIPEFTEDSLYGITVSQTGSTVIPNITVNNSTRSFSALWGASSDNEVITPTLTIGYTSPFKNSSLSNSISSDFSVIVRPPYPSISFSNQTLFTQPVTSGGNVTIGVSTLYAKSYVITSSLGNAPANTPAAYSNISAGVYTITATATNGTGQYEQNTSITGTLTVQAAAPILSQLPQVKVGRNLYSDINTLPYVNLNGSSFSNLEIVTPPSQGTLTVSNYLIRYIPNQDYTGTDLFSFRVKSTANTYSNTINTSLLTSAPSFNVGTANEPIVFNSTEVGATRDLIVPITNSGTTSKMEIHSISIDQDFDDFKLVLTSGQTESEVSSISNIDINPSETYNVKIRIQPSGIGVRTARLKIDHN